MGVYVCVCVCVFMSIYLSLLEFPTKILCRRIQILGKGGVLRGESRTFFLSLSFFVESSRST